MCLFMCNFARSEYIQILLKYTLSKVIAWCTFNYMNDTKVILLGNTDVGKTCIATRMDSQLYTDNINSTVGGSKFKINRIIDNIHVEFSLWDTAGQEKYRALAPIYIRDANLILVVFDLTSQSSFDAIEEWVELARNALDVAPEIVLIGNKYDLSEKIKITPGQMNQKQEEIGATTAVQVSAKTNYGIESLILTIHNILKEQSNKLTTSNKSSIGGSKLFTNGSQKTDGCCV
ncbi:GTP-binding protein YPT6 [Tritrichomonas foetus]|uniref:GTP-binding protein YPT6 n=1 Tax=Tritrichomonas foetus TaxID=1144522 RepID=A0A1J4KG06_9EUKA|nr:GTP-binding protein YPT6 [Tritrichomonas foetus]|eukprot:OHT08574.1 GTP-binding protein YPT6 [Tritrichomonas foetus]